MSKKNPTPIAIPRDGVQRTLNVTQSYELIGCGKVTFWKLRKKHNLQRVEKSTDDNPRYRLADVVKIGVLAGYLYLEDDQGITAAVAEPQGGQAKTASAEAEVTQLTTPTLPTSPAGERILQMTMSEDPEEVFAVDYYDSYLIPENLRHISVAEYRRLKNPLTKWPKRDEDEK